MKNLLGLIVALFFVFSCGKDSTSDIFKGEDLTPSKTIGKVGNYWDFKARGFDLEGKISVTSNEEGVTTFEAVLPSIEDKLGTITYKGQQISGDSPMIFRTKISTNTIATFDYSSTSDDDPFILIKFNGTKGDKYTQVYDGKTTVREITNDKFEIEAFGWIIKAFEVTETLPDNTLLMSVNGNNLNITKIVYLVNHRFGPVLVRFYVKGSEGWPIITIDALNTNCDTKG